MNDPVEFTKYNLVTGENDFTSPGAPNPQDARKLQSLIPSISGEMGRERPVVVTATIGAGSSDPVVAFWQFKRNSLGTLTIHYFIATKSALYHTTNAVSGPWTKDLTLSDVPVFWNIANVMHISDGTTSWIFNGINYTIAGLPIPVNPPNITATAGAGTPALVLVYRLYRITYDDDGFGSGEAHQSSSSPLSAQSGPINASGSVKVRQEPGTISRALSSNQIVGIGTAFNQRHVGMKIGPLDSAGFATITAVADATHCTIDSAPSITNTNIEYNILPFRATGWNVYASSSETDSVCNFLATVDKSTTSYTDTSPMIGATGSLFSSVTTPLLNDPPNPTRVADVYQRRAFSRVEGFPNFFSYSGFEEILAEQAGSPYESVPGADPNTVSPAQVNETSMPDQSAHITCIKAHGDAVYFGTEINTIPFFGTSLETFQFSQVNAFSVGMAGRRAAISTPFGLIFLSYDKKLYMYPSQTAYFATQYGGEQTTALVELSRPKRKEFEQISGADFANVQTVFYNYGRRNWLVVTYKRQDATYATWVFDFETKGWFELQQGYTAIGVFEVSPGERVLFGATVSGTTLTLQVIDDLTNTFPVPADATYPLGIYRVYTDFQKPDSIFVVKGVQYEKSDPSMEIDVTVWLDPADPDNPGTGIVIPMTQRVIGAKSVPGPATKSNRFSGTLKSDTGGTCQRVLVEFAVAAGPVNGVLRGVKIDADEIEDPAL
jgi:hypothetical protein